MIHMHAAKMARSYDSIGWCIQSSSEQVSKQIAACRFQWKSTKNQILFNWISMSAEFSEFFIFPSDAPWVRSHPVSFYFTWKCSLEHTTQRIVNQKNTNSSIDFCQFLFISITVRFNSMSRYSSGPKYCFYSFQHRQVFDESHFPRL